MAKATKAAFRALRKAAERERSNICPVVGVHAAAETTLIESLDRNGWIEWDGPSPRINEAGRAVVTCNAA